MRVDSITRFAAFASRLLLRLVIVRKHWFTRYSFALVTVLASLVLREFLSSYLKFESPLLVFLMSVLLSSWFGGTGAGLFATFGGGLLGIYFFIEPTHTFVIHDFADQIRVALYCVEGIAFSVAIGATKLALANETKARQDLQNAVRDLTTAKQAESNANRMKSLFLSNLTHEIRTPLGSITGYIDLLNDGHSSETEKAHYVRALQRNSRFLSKLIDSYLDLSKAESGFLEIELSPTSTSDLIKSIKEMFEHSAGAKGLEFEIHTAGPIPDFFITDPIRLKQILMNLIGNAVKFTAQGYVRITISMESGGHRIQFRVEDSGPGMSNEHKARLFQPFSQGDGSTFRHFGGTGLGLYLSRSLAQRLGGEVTLERTKLGKGSTFLIVVDSSKVAPIPVESRALEASPSANIHGLNILVVDDSLDNQDLICKMLGRMGAETTVAASGMEAITKAQSKKFDAILMDVQMPEMDGYEATRMLREKGYDVPIIALTAHASEEAQKHAMNSGCSSYMTKPIDFNKLSRIVFEEATRG